MEMSQSQFESACNFIQSASVIAVMPFLVTQC